MDIYQLEYILHEPTEDQGWMYWAPKYRPSRAAPLGEIPSRTP